MPSVKIKTFQGEEKVISGIELSITVLDFKKKVEEQLDLKATSQRVIFGGRVLKDDVTLEGSGIKDGDVVHVVAIVRREAPPPAEQPAPPAPVNLFGDAPSTQGGQSGSGGQQGGGQQQIAELLRTPQGQQMLMQIMNDPNALNDPMVRALLNTPDVRRMLQDPAALAQLLGGGAQQQPWPIIPRDVFDVAMDVLNGAPMPERYAQYGESLRREARTSRRAPATGGSGGGGAVGMQHEYVTRAQVNAALDAALGVAGSGDGAHAAVQPTTEQPMDTTGSTTGTRSSTEQPLSEQESQTTEQTDPMDTTADTSSAPTPAVGASTSDSMDTGGGGIDASGGGDQYAQALAQLEAMGFSNADLCRRALEASGGDISMALNFLTGGP